MKQTGWFVDHKSIYHLSCIRQNNLTKIKRNENEIYFNNNFPDNTFPKMKKIAYHDMQKDVCKRIPFDWLILVEEV